MRTETELLLLSAVAERLGLRPHQITYAITSHSLADVSLRIGNRRIFRPGDVKRVADYFGITLEQEEEDE